MKKGLKLFGAAFLALACVVTLASCNKGKCESLLLCQNKTKEVSRHKVVDKVGNAEITRYICDDCYKARKDAEKK